MVISIVYRQTGFSKKMFYAKTCHSNRIKALFELLFQNLPIVCFRINEKGMFLETLTNQKLLLVVFLPAEAFDEYRFEGEEIHIGIGSHTSLFFKTVKKNKTEISFTIDKPSTFDIEINFLDNDYSERLSAVTEQIQNIAPTQVETYNCLPVKIAPANFNSLCRAFKNTQHLNLEKRDSQLRFSFEVLGISKKMLVFGKKESTPELFHQPFKSNQFTQISKITAFVTEPISVYVESGKPVFLECKSNIGSIKIYISPEES